MYIFGLEDGVQVCGDIGFGWMFELEKIVECLIILFNRLQLLWGKCLLIIVGLIWESLDLVCFLFNYSLGKMGFVIVEQV